MSQIIKKSKILLAACMYILASGVPVFADDIDIYTGNGAKTIPLNLLFVIDTSSSMGRLPMGETTGDNKMEIVKRVFNELITDPDPTDTNVNADGDLEPLDAPLYGYNIKVMRFNANGTGGSFALNRYEKLLKDDPTTQDDESAASYTALYDAVNDLTASGNTPIAETLYDATQFFLSNDSPFAGECKTENHMIVLTDGQPTDDGQRDSLINDLPLYNDPDPDKSLNLATCASTTASQDPKPTSNDCMPLVTEYLSKYDFDSNRSGPQTVTTHTIAFDLLETNAVNLLKAASTGRTASDCPATPATDDEACPAYEADSAETLAAAFTSIIGSIESSATSFAAPAVSINSTNKSVHDNEVYFTMFQPAHKPRWEGNVKGYQVQRNADGVLELVDSQSNPVLDSDGVIFDTAQSKWSATADGAKIVEGGVESKIPVHSSRNVYTYTGGVNKVLSNTANSLAIANTTLTNDMIGAADSTERDNLIKWARGEVFGDHDNSSDTPDQWYQRHVIGDPLHSQPVVLNYDDGKSFMFFGTNDGYMHAIRLDDADGTSGVEEWAFMPKELLGNIPEIKANATEANLTRPYGLDGEITAGIIDGRIYLFFGMRRGGRDYYALDVTTVAQPTLAWHIDGGEAGGSFEKLAQSWSKPLLAQVKLGGTEKVVLIFGGGYDTVEDAGVNTSMNAGNAIYIVNAKTGAREFLIEGPGTKNRGTSALVIPEMNKSIPSSIAALDVDLDEFVDRLYAVDISGQVFRIDLNATETVGGTTTVKPNGGRIASLRTSGTGFANRRFYNEPEIVFTRFGIKRYISLNIGSGYRAEPLDKSIQDRFYSIRDENVYGEPDTYTSVDESSLYNATSSDSMSGIFSNSGWYINIGDGSTGEKVLASSFTINNKLLFTSYTPANANPNACTPPAGTGKLYALNLFDGSAVIAERAITLEKGGIPPSPTVLFSDASTGNGDNPNTNVEVLVGMEPIGNVDFEVVLNKNTWEEQ